MRPHPITIDDADDPRIAPYAAIRERDLVGRRGVFVAEGKVVLNVLFSAHRFEPLSALILENRLEGVRDTLALAPVDMPVYVAPQAVLDRVAGFHVHRGVLALGRPRKDPGLAELLSSLPPNALVVGLLGISNHDNVGSIFRNAAAFEADAVVLDAHCCDPLYRKAIRVSVGAVLKVPYTRAADREAMLEAFQEAGFTTFGLSPHGEIDVSAVKPQGRTALLLGAEGEGLPEYVLQRTTTVRIDMSKGFDSLNVAAASAIALHRFWRG